MDTFTITYGETVATTKGQVVIPALIRQKLNIIEGTRFLVEADTHQIIMTPVTREFINSLCGKYKGKSLLTALAAEKEKERDR